jgi:drug/metabolite transporter (DMT)-like permease
VAMSWTRLALLLLVAVLLAAGQVLFKIAAQSIKEPTAVNFQAILQLTLNPYLLASLSIYAIATLAWVVLLRDTDLTKGYLFVIACSLVLVSIAGAFLLREPLSARLLIGMVIVLVGLTVAFW